MMTDKFVAETVQYTTFDDHDSVHVTTRIMIQEDKLEEFRKEFEYLGAHWQRHAKIPGFLDEQLKAGAYLQNAEDGAAAIIRLKNNGDAEMHTDEEEHHFYENKECVEVKRIEYLYFTKDGKPALPTSENYTKSDLGDSDRYPCRISRHKGVIAFASAVWPGSDYLLELSDEELVQLNALQEAGQPTVLPRPAASPPLKKLNM